MHDAEGYVLEALRSGASGYVLKTAAAEEVVRAVREVAAGRRYLSPEFANKAAEAWIKGASDRPEDPYDTLSPREREVLQLAAEGLNNVQIGQRLFISPRTAEVHRGNIMKKLGLGSPAELLRYAMRRGLVPE
jgi:DNA-binding NarL/FixJ family response regulator